MKLIPYLLLTSFLFIYTSCSKDQSAMVDDCELIEGATILEGEERPCIYNDVYLYQGEKYVVWHCCVCDYIVMAVDCLGAELCDYTENCMIDFFQNATYLYSTDAQ